jgi:hypothetical protein
MDCPTQPTPAETACDSVLDSILEDTLDVDCCFHIRVQWFRSRAGNHVEQFGSPPAPTNAQVESLIARKLSKQNCTCESPCPRH